MLWETLGSDKPPVVPQHNDLPVIASERWTVRNDTGELTKRYDFRRSGDRLTFVIDIMKYENRVQHHSKMVIDEESVTIKLITHGVDEVTERDKEFARYADVLYRDLVYSLGDE